MERRDFFKKLVRSLFIITAVAAIGFMSRPTNKNCKNCQKEANCGLTKVCPLEKTGLKHE